MLPWDYILVAWGSPGSWFSRKLGQLLRQLHTSIHPSIHFFLKVPILQKDMDGIPKVAAVLYPLEDIQR